MNVNNRIFDNVIDGPIRFEGREGGDNGCRLGSNVRLKTVTSPVLRGMRTNVVNKSNRILNISNSTVFADAAAGVVEDRKVVVTKETLRTVGSLRSAEGIMRHFITR